MAQIKTPQQAAAAWLAGMSSSTAMANYKAGTAAVTESPMAAAAAAGDKAVANFTASVMSGQWAAALNAVTTQAWKAACSTGASRLQSGAQKGQAKYLAQNQAMQPTYQQMRAAVAALGPGASGAMKAQAAIAVIEAAGKKGRAMA